MSAREVTQILRAAVARAQPLNPRVRDQTMANGRTRRSREICARAPILSRMDTAAVGIALTALVGVAGILSTHLLARSQRKGESERVESERRGRYRFAEYQTRLTLYADYLAALRSLVIEIRLRTAVTGAYRRKWAEELASRACLASDGADDATLRELFAELANALESDPARAMRFATTGDDDLPPAIEPMPVIRRITELGARIGVVSGKEMAEAALGAERLAVSTLLRLQAEELTSR